MYRLLLCLLFLACAPKTEPTQTAIQKPVTTSQSIDNQFDTNYLTGKFDPARHPDFTMIDSKHTRLANVYLRKDAYNAFKKMYAEAAKEGIQLTIISATRTFAAQKIIWEGKWTGKIKAEDGSNLAQTIPDPTQRALKILEYSSMPSTSRHHWGTDMDLISLNNAYFEKGKGAKAYQWLLQHAATYGFCQPYTEKGAARPNGYHEEKWHWSYQPIAQQLTEAYPHQVPYNQINGFLGAETATNIHVIRNYVQGISQICFAR
jgi:zinc D-Ala-D-Ala carboxypeptidase